MTSPNPTTEEQVTNPAEYLQAALENINRTENRLRAAATLLNANSIGRGVEGDEMRAKARRLEELLGQLVSVGNDVTEIMFAL